MKTRKVYVITDGQYSDYHIKGVALSKEDADFFAKHFGGNVEEYTEMASELRKGFDYFFVRMTQDGTCLKVEKDAEPTWFHDGFDIDGNFFTHVWAKGQSHAVKIVNERRAQIIAANAWGDSARLQEFPWWGVETFN